MVHPRPQTSQEEWVTKPRTILVIVLILSYEFAIICVHGNLSNPLCGKKVRGHKYHRRRKNAETVSHKLIIFTLSKYCPHPVQNNQYPERACHHRPPPAPSILLLNKNYIPNQLDISLYLYITARIHIAHLTDLSADSSHCIASLNSRPSWSGQRLCLINSYKIYAVSEIISAYQ